MKSMKDFGIIYFAPSLISLKYGIKLLEDMIEVDFSERQSVKRAFYVISDYLEKLPKAHILSHASHAFAISEEELSKMKDIYDGSHVSFEVLEGETKEKRWAKNIKLYEEGDRLSTRRKIWELENECRLLRLKAYAPDDKS